MWQWKQGTFSKGQDAMCRFSAYLSGLTKQPRGPLGQSITMKGQVSMCVSFSLCIPTQEQPTLVQRTWILPIKALTVTLTFNLSPSILARQSGQVQGLEPMLCLEIISRRQVLQALCPQGMDTGLFINSLLEWNRTDKKIVVCAKKKKVPKIWTAMRNKSKQTVP